MNITSPHFPVRTDWLAQLVEEVIDPSQVILDAHHHLWNRPEGKYEQADFMSDARDGHDVRASVYVQCRTGYRQSGIETLRPVGEVETILQWSATEPLYPARMVAFADLQLGDAVSPVLEQLKEVGGNKVCGIRNSTAFHPDPRVRSNPISAPDGLLSTSAFQSGARQVAKLGWCLDVWAYHTQLQEVYELAKALPDLTIVIDHCGGPLGIGPFSKGCPDVYQVWSRDIDCLAQLPNTRIKLGGFGLSVLGHRYADAPIPPNSSDLAFDWQPYVSKCIEAFGPSRAMFQSNFPVDKGQFSYRTLWNAFKRLSSTYTASERNSLFWRTAANCYGIDMSIFINGEENRS